jgi:starch phosphorylase
MAARSELPETWLQQPHAWEFERPETRCPIGFGGTATGRRVWAPDEAVLAAAYDTPIVGWNGSVGQHPAALVGALGRGLRPGQLQPRRLRRRGDPRGAGAHHQPRALSRRHHRTGKELRLKQEYFFTAASLADILRRFDIRASDIRLLPQKVAIQLNDTHPAIAGPELVRLLHDERGLPFDEAMTLRGTLGYTNHTLLPEALERWPEELFGALLPRHLQIIDRIDTPTPAHPGARSSSASRAGEDGRSELRHGPPRQRRLALHTELMKDGLRRLNRLHPERIVNQTNGVTPRRWLLPATRACAAHHRPDRRGLGRRSGDSCRSSNPISTIPGSSTAYAEAKRANKVDLERRRSRPTGRSRSTRMHVRRADQAPARIQAPASQHPRGHRALAGDQGQTPRATGRRGSRSFAGKAAPGYHLRQGHHPPDQRRRRGGERRSGDRDILKIVFLPNYNVSLAERLIPAADLSEQISTAGKEASGTGNMKFALNGALTIGTLDGANVEIREQVGAENFFLFGMTAEEAMARRMVDGHAARSHRGRPAPCRRARRRARWFIRARRARPLCTCGREPDADTITSSSPRTSPTTGARSARWTAYRDTDGWARMAALNTARSGWFSSDRTIRGYLADIWHAEPLI